MPICEPFDSFYHINKQTTLRKWYGNHSRWIGSLSKRFWHSGWLMYLKIPLLCGKKRTQEMKKFSICADVVTDPLSDPVTVLGTGIIVTIKSSGATFLHSSPQHPRLYPRGLQGRRIRSEPRLTWGCCCDHTFLHREVLRDKKPYLLDIEGVC